MDCVYYLLQWELRRVCLKYVSKCFNWDVLIQISKKKTSAWIRLFFLLILPAELFFSFIVFAIILHEIWYEHAENYLFIQVDRHTVTYIQLKQRRLAQLVDYRNIENICCCFINGYMQSKTLSSINKLIELTLGVYTEHKQIHFRYLGWFLS